jgi:hypothetical protein
LPASLTLTYSSSSRVVAPTALPMVTPTRSGSGASRGAADPHAQPAVGDRLVGGHHRELDEAVVAVHLLGGEAQLAASKSTSAATCDRKRLGSKKVIRRVAVRPAVIMSQKPSRPMDPAPPRRSR